MTEVPEMSDLYRQLLQELTTKFGATLDEANADAIAYAAADLYHRDFEPRLWEEKSAHDVLDLFGVPRAGVFSPYSLADRLVVFQRRSSRSEYVSRAHDVLTALGVPRYDTAGNDHSLKTRLDIFLSRSGGTLAEEQLTAAGRGEKPTAAEEIQKKPPAEPPTGLADFGDTGGSSAPPAAEETTGEREAAPVTGDGQGDGAAGGPEQETEAPRGAVQVLETVDTGDAAEARTEPPDTNGDAAEAMADAVADVVAEAVTEAAAEAGASAEVEASGEAADPAEAALEAEAEEDAGDEADDVGEVVEETATVEVLTELPVSGLVEEELPEDELTAGNGAKGTDGAPESTPLELPSFEEDGPTTQAAGVDVNDTPGAAPLVEAVRALEQAARVEAELEVGPEGTGGVDLVRLSVTLNGLQAEMVALRTLVGSLGNELRERLEAIHEEVLTATGSLQPASSVVPAGPTPAEQVTRVMPPVEPVDTGTAEREKRSPLRRVWLVILLLLVALLLAGLIVIIVAVGWDRIQSEVTGVVSSPLRS